MAADRRQADLVLEGGGVLGIAHVGAISALEERGYSFPRVAGTSAGAIVGALVAAGMGHEELGELMRKLDYRSFRDKGMLDRVPLVGRGLSALLENGIYEGDHLREWLGNLLADLGKVRFGDLLRDDDDDGAAPELERRYKLVVIAADVTHGELVRLPWDYGHYGLNPDQQLIVDAVRASMSIPLFYEPVKLPRTGDSASTLVDGGLLSNFPIEILDRTDLARPRWPTFGVKLIPELPAGGAKLFPWLAAIDFGLPRFLEQLAVTAVVGHDQGYLAKPWVSARTIRVDVGRVNPIDFGIDRVTQERLFEHGRGAARRFLEGWNFDDYVATYRVTGPA
jgi:NTE family protein